MVGDDDEDAFIPIGLAAERVARAISRIPGDHSQALLEQTGYGHAMISSELQAEQREERRGELVMRIAPQLHSAECQCGSRSNLDPAP
jgi:hypothetical protein